jgi:hypothetical protein
MASTIQIAITEYLKSTYRPDREYIDGEIREPCGEMGPRKITSASGDVVRQGVSGVSKLR